MSEQLKTASKRVRKAHAGLSRALIELVESTVDRALLKRELPEGVEEAEEVAEEKVATPAKKEKKEKKEKEEEDGPVDCHGNLETGEACDVDVNARKKSSSTKHGGKLHPTCTSCKKEMAKIRNARQKELNKNASTQVVPEAQDE